MTVSYKVDYPIDYPLVIKVHVTLHYDDMIMHSHFKLNLHTIAFPVAIAELTIGRPHVIIGATGRQ